MKDIIIMIGSYCTVRVRNRGYAPGYNFQYCYYQQQTMMLYILLPNYELKDDECCLSQLNTLLPNNNFTMTTFFLPCSGKIRQRGFEVLRFLRLTRPPRHSHRPPRNLGPSSDRAFPTARAAPPSVTSEP